MAKTAAIENKIDDASFSCKKFVSFLIEDETYGISVLKVHEIIAMTEITEVPKTLDYIKGVINLRGKVVPVIDLRLRFKMEERQYDCYTVIIIADTGGRMIGMIVDSVSDVLNIPEEKIQQTVHFSSGIEPDFIESIAYADNNLVIILNVENIVSIEELDKPGNP